MNEKLLSWGRIPYCPQKAIEPQWQSDIAEEFKKLKTSMITTLPYGSGRSYGDCCLAHSSHVLHTKKLNRFIRVDWEGGVLVAESGVTLAEIIDLILPHGWFLPVTPGTKYVTLGGAVANDVHGKNHHIRGTFASCLRQFGLHRSDLGSMTCSASENPELFAATIGGLGLTGVITWVEINLLTVESAYIDQRIIRFSSVRDFLSLSCEHDAYHEYTVAWIDCAAKNNRLGRGILFLGKHTKAKNLEKPSLHTINVPFTPPFSLINRMSLSVFNKLYYASHPTSVSDSSIHAEKFFYPLDRIRNWNRAYGRKGFQQYQCVVPIAEAVDAIETILTEISKAKTGSFLAVLKKFGSYKSPGLMSFPTEGLTLALDFPQGVVDDGKLFSILDAIVVNSRGRIYPAKDAHMTAQDFKKFYPSWETIESSRDPLLNSKFWKRVTA